MKLQLNRESIHSELFEELAFDDYLKRFEIHLPFLTTRILTPKTKEEGLKHYSELKEISSLAQNHKLDLEEVISLCARILPLDATLQSLTSGNLEQFHLYLIYTYTHNELLLHREEESYPLQINQALLEKIKKLLIEFCDDGAKTIRLSAEEKRLKEKIYQSDKNLESELQKHEKEIFDSTGLSLLYPYPKEILSPTFLLLEKIQQCKALTLEQKSDIYILHHKLSPEVKTLEEEVKKLRSELELEVKNRLILLNTKLQPYINELKFTYENRKERAYLYALSQSIQKYHFSLPAFIPSGFKVRKGHLPCLEKVNIENYIPLDLNLEEEGSHVLFGANMAGKTSVLKTLYFLLTLVRLGLPLPVEHLQLRYPEGIEIHLKNSGKIRQKLSGFADEINFFCPKYAPGSYLLVDELFHSTNPLAGLELSKVFLSYFAGQDLLLFCTSFYPEVLYMQGIHFYKMLDSSLTLEDERPLADLLSQTPFRIERLYAQDVGKSFKESQQPLKLALHFPLSDDLKKNIKAAIKD